MKIGVMDGVLRSGWDELYGRAKSLGFDGVELGVARNYAETDLWNSEGRARLKALSEQTGMPTASTCIHTYWAYSFASPDEETRARALQIAREAATATAGVGARNILVPLTCPKDVDPDVARRRWIEGVSAAAPSAEKAGVVFCLENVNQPFADTADHLIEIADAIGSPTVKVYYDAGNAVKSGHDPLEAIGRLEGRIGQVHVKEVDGLLLGEGKVPWKGIVAALKQTGYDGWLMLETNPTENPDEAAKKNLQHLSGLLSS